MRVSAKAEGAGRKAKERGNCGLTNEGKERRAKRVVLRLKVRGTTVRRELRARGRQGEVVKDEV